MGGEVYGKIRLPCSGHTCGSAATCLLVPQVLPPTAESTVWKQSRNRELCEGRPARTRLCALLPYLTLKSLGYSWAPLHFCLSRLERDPLLTNTYLASEKDSGKQVAGECPMLVFQLMESPLPFSFMSVQN